MRQQVMSQVPTEVAGGKCCLLDGAYWELHDMYLYICLIILYT